MSKLIRLTRNKNRTGETEEIYVSKQHIEFFYHTKHEVFDEVNKEVTCMGLVDGVLYVNESVNYIAKCMEEGV